MAKILSSVPTLDATKIKWSGKHGSMDMHTFPGNLAECRLYEDACDIGFLVKGKNETRLFGFDRVEYKHHESFPSMKLYIFKSLEGNTVTIRA